MKNRANPRGKQLVPLALGEAVRRITTSAPLRECAAKTPGARDDDGANPEKAADDPRATGSPETASDIPSPPYVFPTFRRILV